MGSRLGGLVEAGCGQEGAVDGGRVGEESNHNGAGLGQLIWVKGADAGEVFRIVEANAGVLSCTTPTTMSPASDDGDELKLAWSTGLKVTAACRLKSYSQLLKEGQ